MTSQLSTDIHSDKILILDFGAQYTQLIARRIREIGVYCEIWAWDHDPAEIAGFGAKGIILSGGPESTTLPGAPAAPQEVFDSGLPILGICYGMQTLAAQLGGATEAADQREFGHAEVDIVHADALFSGLTVHPHAQRLNVWMSHGDHVSPAPPAFTVTARPPRLPRRRNVRAPADARRGRRGQGRVRRAGPPRRHAFPAGPDPAAPLRHPCLRLCHAVDGRAPHRRPDRARARSGGFGRSGAG